MFSLNADEKRKQKLAWLLKVKRCQERGSVSFLTESRKCPWARQYPYPCQRPEMPDIFKPKHLWFLCGQRPELQERAELQI